MSKSHVPTATFARRSSPAAASAAVPPGRDAALDLTRAAITLLVIAHHAVLAYHLYAPPAGAFSRANLIWGAFPIVDAARAPGLDGFTLWNDSFFMAMMFLLAGLFVPSSLARKGAARFLRDRTMRLGLPFVLSAAALAPLAYYPAYLLRAEATGHPGFWNAWTALGVWPAGPAWFLWVLLAFSAVVAGAFALSPAWLHRIETFGAWCRARPARACVVFGLAATILYLPTLVWVSGFHWTTWGPFTVQTGRVALYVGYFVFGCALGAGASGISAAWMTSTGPLARRWKIWQAVAGVVFAGFAAALIAWFIAQGKGGAPTWLSLAVTVFFAVTGVTTTFAVLATFARWGHRSGAIATSLARNAYGMYLVHYVFVTWTQFALLDVAWPGWGKAGLVTAIAISASWLTAAMLRRVPGIRRVL